MTDLYENTGRRFPRALQVTQTRAKQLGGFRIFTGGDNEPYLPLAHAPKSELANYSNNEVKLPRSRYYSTKQLEHKKASHETQLITSASGLTLEGQVDLNKVADIRRTLRRRYHARGNFREIFNSWDINSLGMVRPEDVHIMMNRIGIPVNMDEAKVLVASACRSRAGVLRMEEFIYLICSENDKLNVDLAQIDPASDYHSVVSGLSANHHFSELQNTLKRLLQERYGHIVAILHKADNKKCGVLTKEVFNQAIFDLGFPPHLTQSDQLSALYKEFGGDDQGISYKVFCEKLKHLKVGETVSPRMQELANPVLAEFVEMYCSKVSNATEGSVKLSVLDPRTQPPNKLDQIHYSGRSLKRQLMQMYKTEEKLAEGLLLLSDGPNISQDNLREFLKPHIKDVFSDGLRTFLSAFIFNAEGRTSVAHLVKYVFAEEYNSTIQLQEKKRAVPLARKDAKPLSPASLMNVLTQIEARVLHTRSGKGTSLMEIFDRDKDGYVSAGDLHSTLKRFDIACSQEEAQGLIDLFDNDVKGHLSVNDLAKCLQQEILDTNADKLKLSKSFNSSQPSTEFLQSQLSKTQDVNHFYSKTRSQLVPKLGTIYSSTRYGASPPHKNTFSNVQADPISNHYLSEDSRLSRKSLDPINFGNVDKAKNSKFRIAKEDRKRNVISSVQAAILGKTRGEELRSTSILYSKAVVKERYLSKFEESYVF